MTEEASTLLTSTEVARRFRVSLSTVGKWADEGKLPSFRTPGGHRRFELADVEALIEASKALAADRPAS